MTPEQLLTITSIFTVFLFGIVIGSFLNVCIYRIPLGESVAKERSHCMSCGYQLKWYDLVPLFSWLCLGGKCRNCKTSISGQYPLIEAINGVLYVIIFQVNGWNAVSILYCLMTSALVVLSVIDFRTFEIPFGINVTIAVLGVGRILMDLSHWQNYVIGFFAVSAVLELLLIASGGRAIGGGDVKLMAAAGLVVGWKLILLAFLLGCIFGSIIHLIRMKVSNAEHVLAMGPYLSMGIFVAMLWGEAFLTYYFGLFI